MPQNCINRTSFALRMRHYKNHPLSLVLLVLVLLSAAITLLVLFSLIAYILIRGIPCLSLKQFAWNYTTDNCSMLPALINTLIVVAMTLLFTLPIGIGAAVYLTEYARRGSRLVLAVRLTSETLSGIPSIVYGLFGFLFFHLALGWGYSMLGGILTLSIMILPLIMRTTEEALLAVPDSYREGSYGLGAGHLRTIFCVVLPPAVPGILSGVILAVGRVVGETAALLYPAGTSPVVPTSLMNSGRTLAVHMFALLNEGLQMEAAYATAVVLLLLVVGINALSDFIAGKLSAKEKN